MSDIEFLEGFEKTKEPNQLSKSGIDAIPLVSDFFPERISKLKFYGEIYNADKTFGDSPYLLTYSIVSAEDEKSLDDYVYYARQHPEEVTVLLKTIDISKLPSGNYYLKVEARTKENELALGKKVFFFRSNSAVTKSIPKLTIEELSSVNIDKSFVNDLGEGDSLKEYALSVYPIAGNTEKDFIRKYFDKKDPEADVLKRFLYVFWSARDQFDPESEFLKYQQQVDYVNSIYGTSIKKGYETDRGRVYLQYGKPNTIFKRPHDPNKYPYEIWHFYDAIKRANGRFVFYNRDMVTNDYELLHSDVYGEVNQPRWQYLLEQRTEEINDLDQNRGRDYFGNQSDEFFNMPR